MSGAHEGCSQGKSVRDREGSKHSTAATLERVDNEAAVLPQDFEDTVHARQLLALCRRVGRRMIRQGPGRSPSIGLTHLNRERGAAARKSRRGSRIAGVEKFVGSRFTPTYNTSSVPGFLHVAGHVCLRGPAQRSTLTGSDVTSNGRAAVRYAIYGTMTVLSRLLYMFEIVLT